jgi:CheY-like chemotaxis protein
MRTLGKVMVVDDSMMVRRQLVRVLSAEGHVVLEACDGVDALEKFRLNPEVKLIFLDMNMPRMSGVELLREIRAMHATQPDVVLLTADLLAVMEHDARELGVKTWLSKPVKDATVLAVVRKLTPDAA